jgi:hypothetical protein
MKATAQQLQHLLAQYGWQPQSISDDVITLTYVGNDDEIGYPMFLLMEENWVRVNVPLLIAAVPSVSLLALRLNSEARLARLVVDDDETITAVVDINTENGLTYETFEIAIDAVTYLAETASPRLAAVAQNLPDPALLVTQPPTGAFTLNPNAAAWSGLESTQAERVAQEALAIVQNQEHFSGIDTFGNAWFAANNPELGQVWVQTRDNVIRAFGVNPQPRQFLSRGQT